MYPLLSAVYPELGDTADATADPTNTHDTTAYVPEELALLTPHSSNPTTASNPDHAHHHNPAAHDFVYASQAA